MDEERFDGDLDEGTSIDFTNVDVELLNMFGMQRYSRLIDTIAHGVTQKYKEQVTPVCGELLENEKKLGRYLSNEDKDTTRDNFEYRDPETLTTFDLYHDCAKLSALIRKRKSEIEQGQEDLELMSQALKALDLDIGYRVVELAMAEKERDAAKSNFTREDSLGSFGG